LYGYPAGGGGRGAEEGMIAEEENGEFPP